MRRTLLFFVAAFSMLTGSAYAQIPANLFPAPGTVLIGQFSATGVQIYRCSLVGSAFQWTFVAPEASLVDAQNRLFARHYGSPEGPVWEAGDGSRVVGRVLQSAPSPLPGVIPWLLLGSNATPNGVLAGTRFVQRLKDRKSVV